MWPRKGRAISTGTIDDEVGRMVVPNRGSVRGKTIVNEEDAMRYPANSREEQGFSRRSRVENERSQREDCEDRIWLIGWRQWFGEHRPVWWIGWSRRFESIRRIWWTRRLRWFVWKGWACSKWKTKIGQVDEDVKDSVDHHDRKSHILLPFLAHSGGSAGLVGADAMKIFVLHDTVSQLTIVFSSIKILSRLLMAFLSIRSHSRYPNSSSP